MAENSSSHGGARKGAGRKAGGANTKTKLIAEQAMAQGITPLEVMLTAMRACWAKEDYAGAAALAKDAAPYCHPRLSSVDAKVSVSEHEAALDELERP